MGKICAIEAQCPSQRLHEKIWVVKTGRQGRSGWEANRPNGSIIVQQPDQKKSRKEVEGKNRDSTLPDTRTWIKVEGVGTTSFHYGEQPKI